MTIQSAIVLINALSIDKAPELGKHRDCIDNISGDALRCYKDHNLVGFVNNWKGYHGLAVEWLKVIWQKAVVVFNEASIEFD